MSIYLKYRKYWHISVASVILAKKMSKYWKNMRKIQSQQVVISKELERIAKNRGIVLTEQDKIRLEA